MKPDWKDVPEWGTVFGDGDEGMMEHEIEGMEEQ